MGIGRQIPKSLQLVVFFNQGNNDKFSYQKSNDMNPEMLKKLTIAHGKTEIVPVKLEGCVISIAGDHLFRHRPKEEIVLVVETRFRIHLVYCNKKYGGESESWRLHVLAKI